MQFTADYLLLTNVLEGTSQSLIQISLLTLNQHLLHPSNPNAIHQYLQFLNDLENNAVTEIDYITLSS